VPSQISDPAPLILDWQPERHRQVRWIWVVRPLITTSLGRSHLGKIRAGMLVTPRYLPRYWRIEYSSTVVGLTLS
jgi:hypothetical protein